MLGLDFNTEAFKIWLKNLGYETSIPAGLSNVQLIERMKQDKKAVNNTIRFVLLEKIGVPALIEIDEKVLMMNLKKFVEKGE